MRMLIVTLLSAAALANPAPGQDAVDELVRRGLLKDASGGSRAVTRYEVVELLDRVVRLYENASKNFVPRSELEPVRQAVQTIREGLELLETRVGNTEKAVEREGRRTGD